MSTEFLKLVKPAMDAVFVMLVILLFLWFGAASVFESRTTVPNGTFFSSIQATLNLKPAFAHGSNETPKEGPQSQQEVCNQNVKECK